jgi:hypothetical protein
MKTKVIFENIYDYLGVIVKEISLNGQRLDYDIVFIKFKLIRNRLYRLKDAMHVRLKGKAYINFGEVYDKVYHDT